MKLTDFDYAIPDGLIAQYPLSDRDAARMMVVDRKTGIIRHEKFQNILNYLKPTDLMVFNHSKVVQARLIGHRQSGGRVEAFLLKDLGDGLFECLIKSTTGQKVGLEFELPGKIFAKILRKIPDTMVFEVQFSASSEEMQKVMEVHGKVPLPPYIQREPESTDLARYQTIYAENPGSVAAPTAGLHFTPGTLQEIRNKGVEIEFVTLHVGLGTFLPIKVENVKEHRMHFERFSIGADLSTKCAQKNNRRLIAVGTTSLRTLESAALGMEGETDLFIYPGFQFRWVDVLFTNFHQPKSSLIVLLAAFLGKKELLDEVYQTAVEEKYRFFSYGDCMLVL